MLGIEVVFVGGGRAQLFGGRWREPASTAGNAPRNNDFAYDVPLLREERVAFFTL